MSRYFSEVVPGVMTRVRLPPDPETQCVTTIVDSQMGDAALLQAVESKSQQLQQQQQQQARPEDASSLAALVERAGLSTTSTAGQTTSATTTPPRTPGKGAGGGIGDAASAPSTPAGGGPAGVSASLTGSMSSSKSSSAGVENVDSILLVYDLDRVETFFRLENHWLPLIEKCYDGKVSFNCR